MDARPNGANSVVAIAVDPAHILLLVSHHFALEMDIAFLNLVRLQHFFGFYKMFAKWWVFGENTQAYDLLPSFTFF